MNLQRSLCAPALLLFIGGLGSPALKAQQGDCPFIAASLQGNYAVVINLTGASAPAGGVGMGLQTQTMDGNGNFSRSGTLNTPTPGSTTGARTVQSSVNVGTYAVNCDGTGTITRFLTRADGTTQATVDDFVITKSVRKLGGVGGYLLALTIVSAGRQPSTIIAGGAFVTQIHTRRAD